MDNDEKAKVWAVVLGIKEEAENNIFSKELGFQVAITRLMLLENRWFKTKKVRHEMVDIVTFLTDKVNT